MEKIKNKPKKGPHSYGSRKLIAFTYSLVRLMGPWPAYALLPFICAFYIIFRPRIFSLASPYLWHRFPGENPLRRFIRYVHYIFVFAKVLTDQSLIGILGTKSFKVDFPRVEQLAEMARDDNGLVILTSHFGTWEAALAFAPGLDTKINMHFEVTAKRNDKHFFEISGKKDAFHMIDPTGFMGGMIEATEALNRKECVIIMGDRAMGWRTQPVSFLGEEAEFPLTGPHLAAVTHSKLIMLYAVRRGPRRFYMDFKVLSEKKHENLDKKRKSSVYLERYVRHLETCVKKDPYMWFNFFDFWNKDSNKNETRR